MSKVSTAIAYNLWKINQRSSQENRQQATPANWKAFNIKEIEIESFNEEGNTNEQLIVMGKMYGGYLIELTDLGEELYRIWQTRGTLSMELVSPKHVMVVFDQESEHKVHFWVQVWGLPRIHINKDNVEKIGAEIGKVQDVDLSCPLEFKKSVARVIVDIDIKERLTKELTIRLEIGALFHITFKYEKLDIFCYFCGVIGHDHHIYKI
ncbi:hypothetical protein IFM89_017802 [Coptis chinensis]|uniref:Zinc knuckle CX2CX4HX4C domain-containing protein n=1 Tax=Coptis chinensis TaxID=261450 RepID=A0A835LHN2_9MAGN|nr:hypothetical protein IFM89_017802 [Coptis chinensis]